MIHPCPYCEKKFTKSVNVQAHVKSIHHQERPFLCSDCGKSFSSKGALKEHQIIHSDTYPYQCSFWWDVCKQSLSFWSSYTSHLQPQKVQKSAKTENPRGHPHQHSIHLQHLRYFTKHQKDAENAHGERVNIMSVACLFSDSFSFPLFVPPFPQKKVVHSDQKKYKCQYCGSSFKRSKALKNHLILHSGLRPYSCPFCDKVWLIALIYSSTANIALFSHPQTFANGSNCRSHKKKAHPVELAALEASGKSTNSAPNIPRLEQLQPKNQPVQHLITVDGSNMILQQLPLTSDDIKDDLQPLQIIQHSSSDSFQIHQIVQSNSPILSNRLLEPQPQWPKKGARTAHRHHWWHRRMVRLRPFHPPPTPSSHSHRECLSNMISK